MLTETHLNDEIKDAEINITGFEIYRSDRKGFKNGGVMLYIRSSLGLGTRVLHSLSHNKIDMIIVECVKINGVLVSLYRPPSADGESFYYVLNEMRRILNENNAEQKNIVIAGDFNLPIIEWRSRQVKGGTRDRQMT